MAPSDNVVFLDDERDKRRIGEITDDQLKRELSVEGYTPPVLQELFRRFDQMATRLP